MKKLTSLSGNGIFTISVALLLLFGANAKAQQKKDSCGCTKDLKKNQVTVPSNKNGSATTIEFYYSKNGEFSSNGSDWVSAVSYKNWSEIVKDFKTDPKQSLKNPVLIKFDFIKLSKLGDSHGWTNALRQLDLQGSEKKQIVDIKTSCSPGTYLFSIKVYLAEKK